MLFITMRLVEGTDLRALIAAQGRDRAGSGPRASSARSARRSMRRTPAGCCIATSSRRTSCSHAEDHVYLTDFGLAKHAAAAGGLTRPDDRRSRRVRSAGADPRTSASTRAPTSMRSAACCSRPSPASPRSPVDGRPESAGTPRGPAAVPSDLRPDLPRGFDAVVQRAMATDPADRYQSAGDLAQAALVAAGELRHTGPQSVVATGEAAPPSGQTVNGDGAW